MLRKPLTGAFQVTVLQARDLDRPPIASKFSLSSSSKRSKPESVVVIKIEDTPRARTHLSRNDKWNEEFDIHVDKANEVEVTIYDKAAGELPIPIGLLWVRLSDVVEELRRKKAGQSSSVMDPNLPNVPGNQAWVPASRVDTNQRASASFGEVPVGQQVENAFPAPNQSSVSEGVTAWFAVEPEGQIELHINFGEFVIYIGFALSHTMISSQEQCPKKTIRCSWRRSWATRSRSKTKRGSARTKRPQVSPKTILHRHIMCLLSRILIECGWYAMRRLQIRLSQEML